MIDAARLVSAGSLQVIGGAGDDAGAADGAQAGSIEAVRYRDEPARDITRVRLRVGPTTPKRFGGRIEELVSGQSTWEIIATALLAAHAALLREVGMFEKRVRAMARDDTRARLIESVPCRATGRSWR